MQAKKNKCNSSPFWYNPVTGQSYPAGSSLPKHQKDKLQFWDSILEFKVYAELCKIFPSRIIHRQVRIDILPSNLIFPELSWKIDFFIQPASIEPILIEAKGAWLKFDTGAENDFCKILRLLSLQRPDLFKRLLVVSDKRWKLGSTKIMTLPIKELARIFKNEYSDNE